MSASWPGLPQDLTYTEGEQDVSEVEAVSLDTLLRKVLLPPSRHLPTCLGQLRTSRDLLPDVTEDVWLVPPGRLQLVSPSVSPATFASVSCVSCLARRLY